MARARKFLFSFCLVSFVGVASASANYSIDHTTNKNPGFASFLVERLDKWMGTNGFKIPMSKAERDTYEVFLSEIKTLSVKMGQGHLQAFRYAITLAGNGWATGPVRIFEVDRKSKAHAMFLELIKSKKIVLDEPLRASVIGVGFVAAADQLEVSFEANEEVRSVVKKWFPKMALDKADVMSVRFKGGKAESASALELGVAHDKHCPGVLDATQVNRVSDSTGVVYFENYAKSVQDQAFGQLGLKIGTKIQKGLNLGPGVVSCPAVGVLGLVYP